MSAIFHKDVYIPDAAKAPCFQGKLTYSRHAQNVTANQSAQLVEVRLPDVFPVPGAVLIEAEVNPATEEVEKQVWRMPLNDKTDMIMAMLPNGFVKTVWLNDKSDTHTTLNRARYVSGYAWRNRKDKPKRVH